MAEILLELVAGDLSGTSVGCPGSLPRTYDSELPSGVSETQTFNFRSIKIGPEG